MDGTKTISSPQYQRSNGTGSSPSPLSPPTTFRCLQSATLVSSVSCKQTASVKQENLWNLSLIRVFLSAAASATSSPAVLGIKEHRDSIRGYQRAPSTMQFYNYQGDSSIHRKQYTGTHLKADEHTHYLYQTTLWSFLGGALSSSSLLTLQACPLASFLSLPRQFFYRFHQSLPDLRLSVSLTQSCFSAGFTAVKWTNQPRTDT